MEKSAHGKYRFRGGIRTILVCYPAVVMSRNWNATSWHTFLRIFYGDIAHMNLKCCFGLDSIPVQAGFLEQRSRIHEHMFDHRAERQRREKYQAPDDKNHAD